LTPSRGAPSSSEAESVSPSPAFDVRATAGAVPFAVSAGAAAARVLALAAASSSSPSSSAASATAVSGGKAVGLDGSSGAAGNSPPGGPPPTPSRLPPARVHGPSFADAESWKSATEGTGRTGRGLTGGPGAFGSGLFERVASASMPFTSASDISGEPPGAAASAATIEVVAFDSAANALASTAMDGSPDMLSATDGSPDARSSGAGRYDSAPQTATKTAAPQMTTATDLTRRPFVTRWFNRAPGEPSPTRGVRSSSARRPLIFEKKGGC
jgi:hypothetical protein